MEVRKSKFSEGIKDVYNKIYDSLCGRHPAVLPWHFQWLPIKDIYSNLKNILPAINGRVLDVGCGDKPYEKFTNATNYIGIDIYPGPRVDVLIIPGTLWPFDDQSFDAVICTQVLEHVGDLNFVMAEITRVLKPGGKLVLTVPFIYNEHGSPFDYRRFTAHEVRRLFEHSYDITEVRALGGVGSSVGTLLLNWMKYYTRYSVILPLWLLSSACINLIGWVLDKMDNSKSFYSAVLLQAVKR